MKNRKFKKDFLDDLRKEGIVEDVHIGRVLRSFGNGRVEVFYTKPVGTNKENRGCVGQAVIRGSFRKGGKRSVPITKDSFVAIADTGLAGSINLEIVGVFSPQEIRDIAKEFDVDPRVLAVDATDTTQLLSSKMTLNHDSGYEFDTAEDNADVDVDNI